MSASDDRFPARLRVVFGLLLFGLGLLVLRIGHMQIVRGEEFADRARRQHFRRIQETALRGSILDRNGRPLVATYHSRLVAANPQDVVDIPGFAAQVAFALRDPAAAPEFSRILEEGRRGGLQFVYLRRYVDRDLALSVEALRLPGLDTREDPRREYPHGSAAAALVGMVGPDAKGKNAGLSGLERRYDALLRGQDGSRSVFRSGALGETPYHLYPERDVRALPGADLQTTIDIAIQQIAEEALLHLHETHAPKSSCAIVLDPKTGEILALAGRPALDPARFPDVRPEALRIPAVQLVYEPGSTLKPFVMAWALTQGAVHPGQRIDCGQGIKHFGARSLRDVKPNGILDLEQVLVKSSNIGMAEVGVALGIGPMWDLLQQLGFFRPTGVGLAGEAAGSVEPRSRWTVNYMLTTVSMGHALTVTPLQLVSAYAALLEDGAVRRPHLVRGAVPLAGSLSLGGDSAWTGTSAIDCTLAASGPLARAAGDGPPPEPAGSLAGDSTSFRPPEPAGSFGGDSTSFRPPEPAGSSGGDSTSFRPPEPPRQIRFSREALRFVREAMVKVVEEGTGRRARIPGVRVGGKTGTSEQYPEGCNRYHASFVGFAPADDPRLLVLVVADDPTTKEGLRPYGGVVAAPFVAEILRRSLPLVVHPIPPTPSESGVRQNRSFAESVRSAAVHWSSVNAEVRMTSAEGRNPDSAGVEDCRTEE